MHVRGTQVKFGNVNDKAVVRNEYLMAVRVFSVMTGFKLAIKQVIVTLNITKLSKSFDLVSVAMNWKL